MWIITLLAFLLVIFLIGYLCKEDFVSTLPLAGSGLIILLYIMGIIGSMNAIAPVAVCVLVVFVLAFLLMEGTGRRLFLSELKSFYINIPAITVIVGIITIFLLTCSHVATWWDDVNYWATDAKALYYLNGFTGKYGNVAPEFGDYPPAIQIVKWCFAKLCASSYKEGLSFGGYYVMNVVFGLPLLSRLKGKKFSFIPGFIVLVLLPGVVNDVWSHGACADVTMGLVYGSLLIAIFDYKEHNAGYYYTRIALFMSVLVLVKSVGFEWAICGAMLALVVTKIYADTFADLYGKKHWIYTIIAILTGASVQLSWWVYCLLNRRIAKLTSSGAHMAAGGYSIPDNAGHKAGLFAKGFSLCPMHTNHTFALDLSALTMLVILFAVIITLGVLKKISKSEFVTLLIYTVVTAIIGYGLIFISHITIFAGETQYETPEVMAISISRYAAPFTLGMLMLMIYIVLSRFESVKVMALVAVFVLITTDYTATYEAYFGYRDHVTKDLSDRDAMIDDGGREYASVVDGVNKLWGHRVLFFRNDTVIHWVKDTYINHEVAPVPTVYAGINPTTMSGQDIANKIKESHAEYLYMEDVSELEDGISIQELMSSFMTENEQFMYETIYGVATTDGNNIILKKVK